MYSHISAPARRFRLLQSGNDGAHIRHPDLRIVSRLWQISGRPAKQRRRSLTNRNQVPPTFDSLQNFKRAVGLHM